MLVERSLDKVDQVELDKEIQRLQQENTELKKQLGYKKNKITSNNYEDLVQENISLKQKLGYSQQDIQQSIKQHSPYHKSNVIGWLYTIFSLIILLAGIITFCIILSK